MPQKMASLSTLKQLELFFIRGSRDEQEDLLWVLAFLKACPVLEKLYLTVSFSLQIFSGYIQPSRGQQSVDSVYTHLGHQR